MKKILSKLTLLFVLVLLSISYSTQSGSLYSQDRNNDSESLLANASGQISTDTSEKLSGADSAKFTINTAGSATFMNGLLPGPIPPVPAAAH